VSLHMLVLSLCHCNKELSSDCIVIMFCSDTIDSVKQSAALCLLRLLRNSPDSINMSEWSSRIIHLLNDQHLVRSSYVVFIHLLHWPVQITVIGKYYCFYFCSLYLNIMLTFNRGSFAPLLYQLGAEKKWEVYGSIMVH
jgi:hypothetical protein